MDVLIKLKEYIQNKLTKQKLEMTKLEEQLIRKSKMLELLNKIKINKINKEDIVEFMSFGLFYNVDVFEKNLDLIENTDKILNELSKNDFDLTYIISILTSINISKKDDIISNLFTIKTVLNIIDDSFNDEILKEEIKLKYRETFDLIYEYKEKIIENFQNNVQNIIYNYITKNHLISNSKKVELEKFITTLEKFNNLFDSNQILMPFESSEMMNEFFQLVKESNLETNEIMEVLTIFIKYNFKKFEETYDFVNSTVIESIDNNRNLVHDGFRKTINEPKSTIHEVEDKYENKDFNLTEEENYIVENIKNLIKLHNEEVDEEDLIFLEDDLGFSLESRKKLYLESFPIEWSLVILDIKYNLLPNLEKNKNDIIKIFEEIIKVNEKIDTDNKKIVEKKNKLKELVEVINSYLIEFEQDLNYFNNLSDSKKNFYNSIINMIQLGQSEDIINQNVSSVEENIMWFKNLRYLIELKEYLDLINESLNNSNLENLESLINIINNTIEQYEIFRKEYKKFNESNIHLNDDIIPLENRKNLVIFGINNDEINSYDDEMNTKLKNCINTLYNEKWSVLRKKNPDHMIANIRYITPGGIQKEYDEKFEPYRIKLKKIDFVRIGIIKINVCKENANKLIRRYGLKNECNSLFIIFNVIKTIATDHHNYKEFNDYIRKNKEYLDYIATLFTNPNANESELFKVIDENIDIDFKINKKLGGE